MSADWQPVRAPYSRAEDLFIIEHICSSRSYNKVKGAAYWKCLSFRMQVKGYFRTYQSLKERYIKHIIPNIHRYNLQSTEVTNLLRPFGEQQKQPKKKDNKSTKLRREYSLKEDEKLIKYVLKENGDLNGNKFWQQLEAKNIILGRTWESLRNRFLRSTIKKLPLLLDRRNCERVLQRINGYREPVGNPWEKAKPLKRRKRAQKLPSSSSSSTSSLSSSSSCTKGKDCSCTDLVEDKETGLSEVIPCASDCQHLSIPATPTPNAEQVSGELFGRMSNCPSDYNDCPDDGKNTEEQAPESTEGEHEEFFIDPLFANYIDDDGFFSVRDGVKFSLGATSFPIVIPWV